MEWQELELEISPARRKGFVTVTLQDPSGNSHTDELRIASANARDSFCKAIGKKWHGVDVDGVRVELEHAAARAARHGKGPSDTSDSSDASDTSDGPAPNPSQAAELVMIAQSIYDFAATLEGDVVAIPKVGARYAFSLDSEGEQLRDHIAAKYWETTQSVVSGSTIDSCLRPLRQLARSGERVEVFNRVGTFEGNVVLDLADEAGRCVVIGSDGWELRDRAPVLFLHGPLQGELPPPARGGRIESLREIVNLSDQAFDLAIGWLLAALMTDVPVAIALLRGQEGVGKSCAAKMLVSLIDPGPAPLRTPPKDQGEWAVTASASWTIAIDNVSHIPEWFSDALCRATGGDAAISRKLYTSKGLSIFRLKRPIMLTSIDPGALRGDFGSRIAYFDLEPIPADRRCTEASLLRAFDDLRPAMLGALLDVLAEVLRVRNEVVVEGLPRMADFAAHLAVVDHVRNSNALTEFVEQERRIAEEVLEASVLGGLVRDFMLEGDGSEWTGTAEDLRKALRPTEPCREFPGTPSKLAGELRRLVASLAVIGIEVQVPNSHRRAPSRKRERIYTLRLASSPEFAVQSVRSVRSVLRGDAGPESATLPDARRHPDRSEDPGGSSGQESDTDRDEEAA